MYADEEDRLSHLARGKRSRKLQLLGLLLLISVCSGLYYYLPLFTSETEVLSVDILPTVEPSAVVPTPDYPVLEVPVEYEAEAGPDYGFAQQKPTLENSDPDLLQQLKLLSNEASWIDWSAASDLARKLVSNVYALSEGDVDYRMLMLTPPQQKFSVAKQGSTLTIKQQSYQRYDHYVQGLESIDSDHLVAVYRYFYPVLEQAFSEFGETRKNLHTEVLSALDLLLATPDLSAAPKLVQPAVFYKFLDPGLEALPASQKQMLRMGPDNIARLKTVLTALRKELAAKDDAAEDKDKGS